MDNCTVINPALQEIPKTAINHELVSLYGQRAASASSAGCFLEEGTILCGKYTVERRLEAVSGEADLYLCSSGTGQYIAKLYKRASAVKQEVIDKLLQIDSPYVARLYESATHNGLPVEIVEYFKNGSLQGKTYPYEELTGMVIPCINEGLKLLHQAGILHKDLKPSNIMLADDGSSVAIIDFGISSVMTAAGSVVVTKTGMTPEYSAPETFRNLFLPESDYYSFGITLFELFTGYAPYANMSADEIARYVSVQRIPFPDNMPALLSGLLSGLTYYDITSRTNKNNPNRRFTYSEVKRWLDGEPLVIPGEGAGTAGNGSMPPYQFMKEVITDTRLLVEAFAQNWEEGKKQLFRGLLTAHFLKFDQETAGLCLAAEAEAGRTNGKDDIIFWKLLYRLYPSLKGFYWKGRTFESLPALGRDLLDRLWAKDKSLNKYFETVVSERLLTAYAALAAPENEPLKKAAAAIEESYLLEKAAHTNLMRTFYLMAYTLSGQKLFSFDGQQFRTVGEFAGYMRERLEESFELFEEICHKLVDYDGNPDLQFEVWLITIGMRKELDSWRTQMRES